MPSLNLTPRPDEASIVLAVETDGLALTGLYRRDVNSWPNMVPVRLDAGTLPTTNPPIVVDYEPALRGLLEYRADFSDGSRAHYNINDWAARVTRTWISVPLWPTRSVAVDLVTSYAAGRTSGNTFHDIIGRTDPAVTLAPLRTRRGDLDVWCADHEAAQTVLGVLDLAHVLQLRQRAEAGLDMYFAAGDEVTVQHYPLQAGMPTRWVVRVPFREVARPSGDLIENLGWSFGDVAAEFARFDQLPATFATFGDLAANVRSAVNP